jgi:pimeloyl-ACP methyl ester carboxylesterase
MARPHALPRWTVIVLVGVVVYVGICLALFLLQRVLIYHPQPRTAPTGTPLLNLAVDGRQVLATMREHEGPSALIYFGGNAEDVSASLPRMAKVFPDHALYLLHYPGYGGAPGRPSEAALVADAFALFDQVAARHPRVTVIGRSLGSGVAIQVASARPVERLVLVTPYDSMEELAARRFPGFPVGWILRDKFESGKYAVKVTAPTLVIAAGNDKVVPWASTDRLLGRFAAGVATLGVVPGAVHNFPDSDPEYVRLLHGALTTAAREPASAPSR